MPTYGNGAPSSLTLNFDSIFSTSVINAKKRITDNISNSNPFFYEMKKNGQYTEDNSGGPLIQEDLLYALTPTDSYDGYDVLSTTPPEGITAAFFQWRQTATPIVYSELERKKNKNRIVNFIETRIKQSELGAIDFFSKSIFQGNVPVAGNGLANLYTARTSQNNGSFACDPLPFFMQKDPTSSTSPYNVVGNIDQSQQAWWRNRVKDFTSITTNLSFLENMDNIYNTCSIGPGGGPKLILVDQITWEVWRAAYYAIYRRTADADNDYPFPNFKFNQARVVWDENMPNLGAGTLDTTTALGGTAFLLNPEFMNIRFEGETDFVKTDFIQPANQDAKAAHILWMGNITINNRRKLGAAFNIPRAGVLT